MKRSRIEPGPGQESVWDYPRPPRLESTSKHVRVTFSGAVVADTVRAMRVLETSHPPVYYVHPGDVRADCLVQSVRTSFCEWKGRAAYYSIVVGDRRVDDAAWYYPEPTPRFAAIKGFVAFYPSRVDECTVDGERVQAQAGDFYGGWITADIVGPFKGEPGSWGW